MFHVARHPDHRCRILRRIASLIKTFNSRREIASEIEDIKTSLSNQRASSRSSNARRGLMHQSRLSSLFTEEAELVGIESPGDELISYLVSGVYQRIVIAVVGVGKTTLAKKVHDNHRVKEQFRSFSTFEGIARHLSISNRGSNTPNSITKSQTRSVIACNEVKLQKATIYLNLRDTRAAKLPRSIRKLHDLESLDLRNSFVEELPVEISTFPELRHLLADDRKTRALKIHGSIKHLEFLQTLFIIKVDRNLSLINDGLQVSTKMRKLGIINLKREHGRYLCTALEKMAHLRSILVFSINPRNEILEVQSISSPPLQLQSLSNLNEMLINEGALPLLKRLEMGPCPKLNKVPSGNQNLRYLKDLSSAGMTNEFTQRLSRQESEIVRHIPILRYDATYDPNDEGSYGAFG
uniref:Disease resistance R13L4/SHOC-2-like LRR domain-containing protein n=1 Tax=Populus trichocarpa TaxID=3694 RepID=A0A2K1YZR4_POPTR